MCATLINPMMSPGKTRGQVALALVPSSLPLFAFDLIGNDPSNIKSSTFHDKIEEMSGIHGEGESVTPCPDIMQY